VSLTKERIQYLLKVYISGQATAVEESELMEWVLEAGEDSELKNYTLNTWNQYKVAEDFSYVDWDEMYSSVIHSPVLSIKPKVSRMKWSRFAAAAVILIALSAGGYFYFSPRSPQPILTIVPKQNDVAAPKGHKAVLILADGTKVQLDSTENGTLAVQGNVKIIKKSTGEISYTGTAAGVVTYNT
jgi:transmembrane sensor